MLDTNWILCKSTLLNVSLTTISIGLIYYLWNKTKCDTSDSEKSTAASRSILIEYMIPKQYIPIILGKGGTRIREIQDRTGASIAIRRNVEECSHSVCSIRGYAESVHLAETIIKKIINDRPIDKFNRKTKIKEVCHQKEIAKTESDNAAGKEMEKQTALEVCHTKETCISESPFHDVVETFNNTSASVVHIPQGTLIRLNVCEVKSPSCFWVRVIDDKDTKFSNFSKLEYDMASYYDKEENCKLHYLDKVLLGQVIAVKCINYKWCRGEVLNINPENDEYVIFLSDYGYIRKFSKDNIFELCSRMLYLPLQAVECLLANVKPLENEWNFYECAILRQLIQEKTMLAVVIDYEDASECSHRGLPIPCVELFALNMNISIADRLSFGSYLAHTGFGKYKKKPVATSIQPSVETCYLQVTSREKSNRSIRKPVEEAKTILLTELTNFYESARKMLPDDILVEVYVSAIITPSTFWVQTITDELDSLKTLMSKMTLYYNNPKKRERHVLKEVTINQVVAARFSRDNQWYRAEIMEDLENYQWKVLFLDYGGFTNVSTDDIMNIRERMLSLPLQAIECSLANVKPLDEEWNNAACHRFSQLTQLGQSEKVIHASVKSLEEDIIYRKYSCETRLIHCIELYDQIKSINIGQSLICSGLADFVENISFYDSSSSSTSNSDSSGQTVIDCRSFTSTP